MKRENVGAGGGVRGERQGATEKPPRQQARKERKCTETDSERERETGERERERERERES